MKYLQEKDFYKLIGFVDYYIIVVSLCESEERRSPPEKFEIVAGKRMIEQREKNKFFLSKFEFRDIKIEESGQAVVIEQICFPSNEACSEKNIKERIQKASELFLVAVEKETGKIAGFLNGIATEEDRFQDKFFTNANLHTPNGANVMLLGLDVLPRYRRQGLARELVKQYVQREKSKNRKTLILTCLEGKVEMYQKMGFTDDGMADSSWGGEQWHQMHFSIS